MTFRSMTRRGSVRIDPLLADALVALNLNALLPQATQKSRARLRTQGADRRRVLAQAIEALVPPEAVPLLLGADGVKAGGNWLGVFSHAEGRLDMLNRLLDETGLADDPVGVALAWRLVFFELAVRIAAASYARAPDAIPTLRHDLWASAGGFGRFLLQVGQDHGLTRSQLVDALVTRVGAGDNVEKSQIERWLYEDAVPQAGNIEPLARAIAIAAGHDTVDAVTALRVRLHLFIGCRDALSKVATVLGKARATALATTFAAQVHAALATFRRTAAEPPDGPNGPLSCEVWTADLRRLARAATVFGIDGGGLGAILLFATNDADLAALVSPRTSLFLGSPMGVMADALERLHPGVLAAHDAVNGMVHGLSLDDVVADASNRSTGRQPLGWLGLLEGVLGSRLPM